MISTMTLTNSPNQTFTTTIQGDTRSLKLVITLSYNTPAAYWVMGIYDSAKAPIILGVPLFCGYDLLAPYKYLDIGSALLYNAGAPDYEYPNDKNLNEFILSWRYV